MHILEIYERQQSIDLRLVVSLNAYQDKTIQLQQFKPSQTIKKYQIYVEENLNAYSGNPSVEHIKVNRLFVIQYGTLLAL